ncbi:MAG: glycoside hydrolase family 3 N-terminal domain-containing protein, partial [Ignavibacteria bacterium]
MKLNINPYFILFLTTAMFIISSMLNHGTSMRISDLIEDRDSTYPSVFELNESDRMWIEKTLSEMSLYQKCAQMIMIPVYRSYMDTTSPDYADVVDLVRNRRVGGLIMFQGELREEIEFIRSMQALTNIPLLVASDFERGLGSRIDSTLEFPHHMSLGATLNSQFAYEMGNVIAGESRLIGIHQNFAPVADINNNALNPVINVRSFSESKYTTANFVSSFVLGTKHGRVISTVKHFPGHGNTEIDSHTELPMIKGEKKYLLDNELYPFIEAIKTGVQSIMIGHLEVPAYDTLPASLSNKIINDLLLNTLGFDGLIVTDALIMEGITKYYSNEEIVLLAVNAGNDIILMPPDPSEAISVIYKAVLEEKIKEDRIDKSVRKILSAKRWLENNSQQNLSVDSVVNRIKNNDHLKLAEEIAASSITLVKNDRGIIPLNPTGYNNISCITVTDGEGDETAVHFQKILKNRIENVDTFLLSGHSEKIVYSDVYNSVKNSDLIFLPLFLEVEPENKSEELKKLQQNFINKILKLRAPVIVISYKSPYPNFSQKNVKTYLNVYSYTEVSQSAALRAILGEENIFGKLPVSIPNSVYTIGYGISLNKTISTELSYSSDKKIQLEKSEKIINKVLEANRNLSAEICFGREGKILYQKSFGIKSVENKNNVQRSNFNLGSVTIPISLTSSLMMLVDEGKLSLDDKLSQHIDINDSNEIGNITIKNLLL